ncbi:MAG TPA: DUF1926 domain-containing protein, partial [Sediminispirochaeta sp.]|nr:DUF1926 domain-containing protein [Sediminispirochaeta sp.]
MRKLKLVLGTYNSPPVGTSLDQFEKAYQYSYKPFLTLLYKYAMLKGAFHFSGTLLEWLDDKHPEFIMVLNEMVKRKQVELIGGGFYSPIFPIIPSKDRIGQIELLTTLIRKKFGKRPRGCWITEGVWEPTLTSTIKNSGMEYLFLDDKLILQSGKKQEDLYKIFITDDQGKTAVVLPLHNDFIERMFVEDPDTLVAEICELQKKSPAGAHLNILINGDFFLVNKTFYSDIFAEGGWLERFFQALNRESECIDTVLPGKHVRHQAPLQRVYLPSQYIKQSNGEQRIEESEGLKIRPLKTFVSEESKPRYFRQFISMYPEIQKVYSKMMYVHGMVGQVRGDRSRKKTAKEESWKGQTHAAFWTGPDGGVYRNEIRKAVYAGLINAEKTTREKGIFSTSIHVTDIDLDGMPEYLYQGQFINAYVHRTGACLFELDYLVTAWNYLDTMARYREDYHTEDDLENGIDRYSKNSFLDHFLEPDVGIENFATGNFEQKIDFMGSIYRARKVEKERKELHFANKRSWQQNGEMKNMELLKSYNFSKNSIQVKYELHTTSFEPVKGRFGVE